jgi:hypothetical protein
MQHKLTPLAILAAVILTLLLLPVTHAASADIELPKWPQTFEVTEGMTRSYAFPITQSGEVGVDLTWTGSPLVVSLVDGAGKAVSSASTQAPPTVHLSFALTQAQIASSNVYAITLAVAPSKTAVPARATTAPSKPGKALKPPAVPKASGKINVSTPPVDAAALQPKLKKMTVLAQKKMAVLRTQGARQAKSQTASAYIAARNAEAARALTTQRQSLLSQMATRTAAASQALLAARQAVKSTATNNAGVKNLRVATRSPGLARASTVRPGVVQVKPAILRGTSDATGAGSIGGNTGGGGGGAAAAALVGFPGDEIVLQVSGIDPSAANTVTFTVRSTQNGASATMNVQGTVYSASSNASGVDLVVGVPNAGNSEDSSASIVVRDPAGNSSPPFGFAYRPIPLPTITGVQLQNGIAVAGRSLSLDGSGFVQGDKVLFNGLPGAAGPVAANVLGSVAPNAIKVTVPSYTSNSQFVAAVYVSYHYQHKHFEADLQGAAFPVTLDATSISLTSADRASGTPEAPVLLSGSGFTSSGTVHCVLGAGKDYVARVDNTSDTAILFTIPRYTGFVNAVAGTIYVERADGMKSNLLSFTFNPNIVHKFIDLSKYLTGVQWSFVPATTRDKWSVGDNGTQLCVHHETQDFWHSASATDSAFQWNDAGPAFQPLATPLKNGWTVSAIDWSQILPNNSDYQVSNYRAHVGTNNPAVFADWFIHIFLNIPISVDYCYRIDISGPEGTDYF